MSTCNMKELFVVKNLQRIITSYGAFKPLLTPSFSISFTFWLTLTILSEKKSPMYVRDLSRTK